jgi:probable F420-dependent oxidoreductase
MAAKLSRYRQRCEERLPWQRREHRFASETLNSSRLVRREFYRYPLKQKGSTMDISRPGVFVFLDSIAGPEIAEFAGEVERLGYSTIWIVEATGRNSLALASWLLAKTNNLYVGTGVASIWARAATTMAAGARAASELSAGRFILGIGSNNPRTAAMRGLNYGKPVTYMREYLSAMKTAAYSAPPPAPEPPILLAALNQKMLALAASDADGTLTYFVPPEHTARARTIVGEGKWVCAEQAVLLETDPAKARVVAREYMKLYLTLPPYRKNLVSLGFREADLSDGGSDRLVDAIVAWGDEDKLRARVEAHYKAGATHVCILPLNPASALSPWGGLAPDMRTLQALAPQ